MCGAKGRGWWLRGEGADGVERWMWWCRVGRVGGQGQCVGEEFGEVCGDQMAVGRVCRHLVPVRDDRGEGGRYEYFYCRWSVGGLDRGLCSGSEDVCCLLVGGDVI